MYREACEEAWISCESSGWSRRKFFGFAYRDPTVQAELTTPGHATWLSAAGPYLLFDLSLGCITAPKYGELP